jgi:hypothetical protein
MSFGAPKIGDSWRNLDAQGAELCRLGSNSCSFQAKVVGIEKVATPAGTFDALKVVVDLNMRMGGGAFSWRQFTYWFAESAKRVVKASHRNRVRDYNGAAVEYDIELVSYKLN